MAKELSQLTFDYGELAKSEVTALERHAKQVEKITERVRKTNAEAAIELGKILADAQQRLANHGNGTFEKWLKQRCGISRMSASRAMRAAECFAEKDCNKLLQTSDVSALYPRT